MATKEKKTTKSATPEKIKDNYIDAVLTGSKDITSVYAFCKSIKIKETTFYQHFNSFQALEDSIWSDWLSDTINTISKDPNYLEFSVREKILSFYFTWFEKLLTHRSFVTISLDNIRTPEKFMKHNSFKAMKKTFIRFTDDLVREGGETGEIPLRQNLINKAYPDGMWLQFLFLMNFWKNDTSRDFAGTDAAIEKSVNLSMDLIGRGPVDSMVDFAKFMYQQSSMN